MKARYMETKMKARYIETKMKARCIKAKVKGSHLQGPGSPSANEGICAHWVNFLFERKNFI